ncbi:MAG: hypothetical protein WBB25_13345 [Sulfitobacter sp.]
MAGIEKTPDAVHEIRETSDQHKILMGPVSSILGVASDFPLRKLGIRAIWRNEVGDAA